MFICKFVKNKKQKQFNLTFYFSVYFWPRQQQKEVQNNNNDLSRGVCFAHKTQNSLFSSKKCLFGQKFEFFIHNNSQCQFPGITE